MTARDVLELTWVVPALPLAGAVVLLLFGGRYLREPLAGWMATATMFAAFAWAVVTFAALRSLPGDERVVVDHLFTWIRAGRLDVSAATAVDPLAMTMVLFVTGVGALIHLYSIGYMHGDPRFPRFFAYMNLFAGSMLVLVLAGTFPMMFVGWEGVGLCSYLLISYWFERPEAAVAGKKAFLTNRVGDVGFLVAMFLVFSHLGTLDVPLHSEDAIEVLRGVSGTAVTAIALLFLVAAVGKSAQLPLHVWLPDAMEGPTPVSALIHAATMVTAGVYLVARAHPFFEVSGVAGTAVAWVGATTAFVAASIALVHNDIKRVLAYSTISQLGYMFLATGVSAYAAAIFHMVTHAFFKALLFLGAGSVMHALHDELDMRRMGGLRRYLPWTAGTFIVAWLAIAGIFPFAGFWSKDEILAQAWFGGHYGLWAVGAVTAALTGVYMTRQVWMVFFGPERWREPRPATAVAEPGEERPHREEAHAFEREPRESPPVMVVPLVLLAGLSVVGGLLNLPFAALENLTRFLEPVFEAVPAIEADSFGAAFVLSTVALALAVGGVLLARSLYARATGTDPLAARLGAVARFLERGWGFDELYVRAVERPGRKALDVLNRGFDLGVVDGAVNGVGRLFRLSGQETRRVQSGYLRRYALAVFGGSTALMFFALARSTL